MYMALFARFACTHGDGSRSRRLLWVMTAWESLVRKLDCLFPWFLDWAVVFGVGDGNGGVVAGEVAFRDVPLAWPWSFMAALSHSDMLRS